jgi:hypothetical protein
MNRWRVGEDRGSKEMDRCPLTRVVWMLQGGVGCWYHHKGCGGGSAAPSPLFVSSLHILQMVP